MEAPKRVEAKSLTFNPVKMAFLESNWLRAAGEGDLPTAIAYMSEGLSQQFHLNGDSAQQAASLRIFAIRRIDIKRKMQDNERFYKIISSRSGLNFSPQIAAEAILRCDDDPSIDNFSDLFSVIYGLPQERFYPAMAVRVDGVKPHYESTFSRNISIEELWQHRVRMDSKLIEYYQLLQQALNGPQTLG